MGSFVDEYQFRRREPADVRLGFSNIDLPHREWFVERIIRGLPSDHKKMPHLVEIGCGWGPNLAVIARLGQFFRLTGIDISPASILEGQKRLNELGLTGITLLEMQGADLGCLHADVLFTDAMLLYVGPDKIKRVAREMLRVARSRLVMLKMHDPAAGFKGRYTRDGWLRNYAELFVPLVGKDAVKLEKLPSGLRTAGRWPYYGTIIEIDLTDTQ